MASNDDMITLNIYNKPPPKSVDETGLNFNQSYPDMNLNIDKPGKNRVFYDNDRRSQNNYNSAPRVNINNKSQRLQNTTDDNSDSSDINQNNGPIKAPYIQNIQYQQPVQPIYQPMIYGQTPVRANIVTPVMIPPNMQYATPVVLQGNNINNRNAVNNAPKTIIIREKKKVNQNKEQDCCMGFLAGCCACLAACCLMGLCCPGAHGPHRHRGRW